MQVGLPLLPYLSSHHIPSNLVIISHHLINGFLTTSFRHQVLAKCVLLQFERWACERKDRSKSENKMHRKKDFCLKHRYNLPKWLLVLIMVCLERDLQRVQTIWHSSLIMEFWMNNVLRMQENNGCEVLHLFLQHLGLLPLTCSVLKKKIWLTQDTRSSVVLHQFLFWKYH